MSLLNLNDPHWLNEGEYQFEVVGAAAVDGKIRTFAKLTLQEVKSGKVLFLFIGSISMADQFTKTFKGDIMDVNSHPEKLIGLKGKCRVIHDEYLSRWSCRVQMI